MTDETGRQPSERDPQWSPYEFLPELRAAMQVEVGFRIEGFSLILYIPPEDFHRLASDNIELYTPTPGRESIHLTMGNLDLMVMVDPDWVEENDESEPEPDGEENESQPPE